MKRTMKAKTRKCLAAMAAVLLLISAAGCNGKQDEKATENPVPSQTAAPTETVTVSPQKGGSITVSMRPPKTLNPILNEDITVDAALKLLFLPVSILDDTLKPVANPAFVESIVVAQDGMSADITLKAGKNWSDGQPITANDILFTLETLRQAPEKAVYKESIRNILSFTAIDSRTVTLRFTQSFSGMPYLLNFPLIPAHYYTGEAEAGSAKNMAPLGNGSFVFESFTPAKEMVLAASSASLAQAPYLSQIHVMITPDTETDFDAYDQGLIDLVAGDITDWGKYQTSRKNKISEYLSTYYDFVSFNFDNPIFQDKAVRQAVAMAIPYPRLLDEVYIHNAVLTNSPVIPGSWLYEPNARSYEYDLEAAGAALASAGWSSQSADVLGKGIALTEGLEGEGGQSVYANLSATILVNSENDERVMIAGMLRENLNQAGFSIEVVAVDFATYQQKLAERDYDIVIGGYHLSLIPDFTFMLHSSNALTGANYANYQDAAMDLLLANAFNAPTESQYRTAMSELQKYIAEELPYISLVFRKSAVISHERLYADIQSPLDDLYGNVYDWFVVK